MGGTREIPSELNGATAAAVADQRRQAERERIRQAEDRCRQNVEGAWRWIDSRPRLVADDRLALFAAQAITLKRIPKGLPSGALEDWLVQAWESPDMAWRWHTHGIDDDTILRGLRWRIETNADPHVDSKPKNRGGSTTPLHNPAEAVYRPVTGRSERMVNP